MPLRFSPLASPQFARVDWSVSRFHGSLPFTELIILAAVGIGLALA